MKSMFYSFEINIYVYKYYISNRFFGVHGYGLQLNIDIF